VRRLLLAPAIPLATIGLVTVLPLAAVVAAALSPRLPGRLRPLRLLWFVLVLLVVESAGVLVTFALWVASGFGWQRRASWFQTAHYVLMRWYVRLVVRTAERTFNLSVRLHGAVAGDVAIARGAPLIVLSRPAGPGDSVLLVHELLERGYRPRVVLKSTLRWAPCLDTVLGRVPSSFVGRPGGGGVEAVRTLAADLRDGEALVLFPEGGNFTAGRRSRSIARLEEEGDHEQAERARELRHVLMPRPGGALAAMRAAPDAHLVLVAHTGLEQLSGLVDLWRGLPMDAEVEAQAWRVPPSRLPADDAARAAWLYGWWRRIDAWIVERRGEQAVPDEVARAIGGIDPAPAPAGGDPRR
jgi:1-acyl-sn-glycerol-3-phosphate acyltransferase